MAYFNFRGGIHPNDQKILSKAQPIKNLLPKGDLVYPIIQHIGTPAVPVVKKGDHVVIGQMIAKASGFISAPIHASVSGTVRSVEPHLTAAGVAVPAVVIENDGKYEEMEWPKRKPLEALTSKEILDIIKNAGIVGMGGAGLPAHLKLSPKEPEKIEYVIANCTESEPYITSEYRNMIEEPEKIIGGLQAILKLFPNAKGIIVVEDNKKDAITLLKRDTKNESRIKIAKMRSKYPQGSERQLIFAATGRQINSSLLPVDAGCIVNNCNTISAIYEAVYDGKPLTKRVLTVTGDAVNTPRNLRVPIGTMFRELIEVADGFNSEQEPEKIIAGGPMMGIELSSLDVPVVKTSAGLLCLKKDEMATSKSTACINCGRCVNVCPSSIIPFKLARYLEHQEEERFIKEDGLECCECGCCTFICPAKLPLTENIKYMRRIILANQNKK